MVTINACLCEVVELLYERNMARQVAVNGLLGLAQRAFWLRQCLSPAWDLVRAWERRVPVELRRPIPASALTAYVGIALLWGRFDLAAMMWLGFHAMLRPVEAASLLWDDLVSRQT